MGELTSPLSTLNLGVIVIASEAKQSHCQRDCFVAALLAMTVFKHVFKCDKGLALR
jgi:hypothetical protein